MVGDGKAKWNDPPARTIFWTLMENEERRSRTHSSNWIWYHHWMCRRTGKEKKGGLTNTIELGKLIQEQGTLEDKIAWGKIARAIEVADQWSLQKNTTDFNKMGAKK